jgi:hypothetical protein
MPYAATHVDAANAMENTSWNLLKTDGERESKRERERESKRD